MIILWCLCLTLSLLQQKNKLYFILLISHAIDGPTYSRKTAEIKRVFSLQYVHTYVARCAAPYVCMYCRNIELDIKHVIKKNNFSRNGAYVQSTVRIHISLY